MSIPKSKWRRRVLIGGLLTILLLVGGSLLYSLPMGKRLVGHATGLFVTVTTAPARFALPQPTGPHAIGTVELHLNDSTRVDPWVAGKQRELMVSIWYPTDDVAGRTPAPYMSRQVAAHVARMTLEDIGLQPTDIDLAAVRTYGWQGAAVDVREGAWPIVLYSPGGSQPRSLGTILVQDLASHGYIVVSIDHTYESPAVEFPDGRVVFAALPDDEDTLQRMIAVRVQDTRFVLDQLERIRNGDNPDAVGRILPEGLKGALDLTKIGMFGYSAGGFTTAQAMYEDLRLDAGINLDGSLGYRIAQGEWGEVTRQGLDRPFLLFGAGFSGAERLPHTSQHAPDWKSLWDQSTGWKLDLYLPEGEHFSFTDYQAFFPQLDIRFNFPDWLHTGMIGTIDPVRSTNAQQAYIAAFFDQHLRGERQDLLVGPSPQHPDVDFIRGSDSQ